MSGAPRLPYTPDDGPLRSACPRRSSPLDRPRPRPPSPSIEELAGSAPPASHRAACTLTACRRSLLTQEESDRWCWAPPRPRGGEPVGDRRRRRAAPELARPPPDHTGPGAGDDLGRALEAGMPQSPWVRVAWPLDTARRRSTRSRSPPSCRRTEATRDALPGGDAPRSALADLDRACPLARDGRLPPGTAACAPRLPVLPGAVRPGRRHAPRDRRRWPPGCPPTTRPASCR